MAKPKGKTPSLLSMSTGSPVLHTCGKATNCDRCEERIATAAACFQIPKQKSGFTARPIFCIACTKEIVEKTKADLLVIEAVVQAQA
ncbi:hypothetical protein HB777_22190 [Mesorhizobium loti]|nr:hypothetical protein HB777_22190 [Mesorhizobium loti]